MTNIYGPGLFNHHWRLSNHINFWWRNIIIPWLCSVMDSIIHWHLVHFGDQPIDSCLWLVTENHYSFVPMVICNIFSEYKHIIEEWKTFNTYGYENQHPSSTWKPAIFPSTELNINMNSFKFIRLWRSNPNAIHYIK